MGACVQIYARTQARTHARIHAYTLRLKIHVNGFGSLKHTTATLSFLCFDFQAKKGTLYDGVSCVQGLLYCHRWLTQNNFLNNCVAPVDNIAIIVSYFHIKCIY